MERGNHVIEISTGDEYIVYDSIDTEICIIQFFDYAEFPFRRQLTVWQPKERFTLIA